MNLCENPKIIIFSLVHDINNKKAVIDFCTSIEKRLTIIGYSFFSKTTEYAHFIVFDFCELPDDAALIDVINDAKKIGNLFNESELEGMALFELYDADNVDSKPNNIS